MYNKNISRFVFTHNGLDRSD